MMRRWAVAGLAALLLLEPNIKEKKATDESTYSTAQEAQYIEVAGLKLKKTNSFPQYGRTAQPISIESLVNALSSSANRPEFQVVYFPEEKVLINLTVESTINSSKLDEMMLDQIISTGELFYLLHNHNNIGLDSKKIKVNPLYWVSPSPNDIRQYMSIGFKGGNVAYGIVTKYGLLTIGTEPETFRHIFNPYFGRLIDGEAAHIQQNLIGVGANGLKSWAESYKAVLKLSFTAAG